MAEYPEHEKLRAVKDKSQALGEFLDLWLPSNRMAIYEQTTRDCECSHCERGVGHRSAFHTEAEKNTMFDDDGRRIHDAVQITEWWPTHRTVQSMLAEFFGIDQKKIDAEKDAMLALYRSE